MEKVTEVRKGMSKVGDHEFVLASISLASQYIEMGVLYTSFHD